MPVCECGNSFVAKRSDAQFCSNRCAQRAVRRRAASDKKSKEMMMTLEGYALVEKLRKIAPLAAASVEKMIEAQGVGCTEAAVKLALAAFTEGQSKVVSLENLNIKLAAIPAVDDLYIEYRSRKYYLCRKVDGNKETKAMFPKLVDAAKWVNDTAAAGRPNYALLRS